MIYYLLNIVSKDKSKTIVFGIRILNLANSKDENIMNLANEMYENLRKEGIDVLLDDRDERPGVKFKDADLIGFPFRITAGKSLSEGVVEFKDRATGEMIKLEPSKAVEKIIEAVNELK